MEPNRSARDVKKDQILDRAAELIMETGFSEMSVRDLAKAVELSQASLYYYIGNKGQILAEIASSFVDETITRLTEVVSSEKDPPEQLTDFIETMLRLVLQNRAKMNAFLRERRALPASAWPEVHAKRDLIDDLLQSVLVRGEMGGFWRPFPLASARLAVFGIVSWALEWLDPEGPKSVEQLAREFSDLVLFGLARRDGDAAASPAGATT